MHDKSILLLKKTRVNILVKTSRDNYNGQSTINEREQVNNDRWDQITSEQFQLLFLFQSVYRTFLVP